MRTPRFSLLVLCCAVSMYAATDSRQNIVVGPGDRFLCQLVDGDGWNTSFFLTNLDTKPINYLVRFRDANFAPLPLPVEGIPGAGTGIFGTIPVGQSVAFSTPGVAAQLSQGWTLVTTFDRPATQTGAVTTTDLIGGQAIFRQRIAGRPDFEAVVPIERAARRLTLPFDNRNNFSTGVALVNTDSTPMPITLAGRDLLGAPLFTDTVTLTNGGKLVFSMPQRYPASNGQIGVLLITTPGTDGVAALGLRFNPTGAFTSTPALAPVP